MCTVYWRKTSLWCLNKSQGNDTERAVVLGVVYGGWFGIAVGGGVIGSDVRLAGGS